ncbi:hypothetical protein ACIF6H_32580 [Streptomyces microflavus]|uniref:hypothetical protein n=1 Tax=Streptomyces microflavus TaxID=1919 RepID=UPI0037D4DBBD
MTTSTPRLDLLATHGSGNGFARIRLVHGNALSIKIRPGAAEADEVFPFPGVYVPNVEEWENEAGWDGRLSVEGPGNGPLLMNEPVRCSLFMDVPVEAIRELIEAHGGEGAEQDRAVYRVTVQRTEIIEHLIEADSPQDARARYLADGEEVGVASESTRIESVMLDEQ